MYIIIHKRTEAPVIKAETGAIRFFDTNKKRPSHSFNDRSFMSREDCWIIFELTERPARKNSASSTA